MPYQVWSLVRIAGLFLMQHLWKRKHQYTQHMTCMKEFHACQVANASLRRLRAIFCWFWICFDTRLACPSTRLSTSKVLQYFTSRSTLIWQSRIFASRSLEQASCKVESPWSCMTRTLSPSEGSYALHKDQTDLVADNRDIQIISPCKYLISNLLVGVIISCDHSTFKRLHYSDGISSDLHLLRFKVRGGLKAQFPFQLLQEIFKVRSCFLTLLAEKNTSCCCRAIKSCHESSSAF